jgi:phosphoribosylanthranilate isomerase
MIGLVRFARSPRHLELEQGRALSARARGKAARVALVVDADDRALAETVEAFDPDLLQLHGSETPQRVAEIRARFGRPVMKAVGIAEAGDLAALEAYAAVADRLLVDAKPPATTEALPGGNGLTFDWRLIAGLDPGKPVMLSGGLDPGNVAAAIALTRVGAVDVSSGVERRPGEKDPARIEAFVKAARAAFTTADPGPAGKPR